MIRSDLAASGVMFTLDTESGFRDVVFITGAYGLGENVVLILNTVKDMTQPEILNFVRNTLFVAEKEIEKPVDISYMGLMRQMRDPEVRRGLALTMRVLHVVGSQAAGNGNGTDMGA